MLFMNHPRKLIFSEKYSGDKYRSAISPRCKRGQESLVTYVIERRVGILGRNIGKNLNAHETEVAALK